MSFLTLKRINCLLAKIRRLKFSMREREDEREKEAVSKEGKKEMFSMKEREDEREKERKELFERRHKRDV